MVNNIMMMIFTKRGKTQKKWSNHNLFKSILANINDNTNHSLLQFWYFRIEKHWSSFYWSPSKSHSLSLSNRIQGIFNRFEGNHSIMLVIPGPPLFVDTFFYMTFFTVDQFFTSIGFRALRGINRQTSRSFLKNLLIFLVLWKLQLSATITNLLLSISGSSFNFKINIFRKWAYFI